MAALLCRVQPGDEVIMPAYSFVSTADAFVQRGARVVAVELDTALLPVLAETLADCPNVKVVPGDIMKLDLEALVREHFDGLTPIVCANLPYNITTPVLTRLLESGLFASVTVMIQREVARRICASPGSGDYGAFTLLCQYHADCQLLFEVEPECFLPAPKVTSQVLRMTRLPEPPVTVTDEGLLFQVIRASFAQRRKKLLNGLFSAFRGRATKEELADILRACGYGETVRGGGTEPGPVRRHQRGPGRSITRSPQAYRFVQNEPSCGGFSLCRMKLAFYCKPC